MAEKGYNIAQQFTTALQMCYVDISKPRGESKDQKKSPDLNKHFNDRLNRAWQVPWKFQLISDTPQWRDIDILRYTPHTVRWITICESSNVQKAPFLHGCRIYGR